MKSLNKSLLAAAVIGAIALPGLSSASTIQYTGNPQITLARDLLVTNGNNITLPTSGGTNLTVKANAVAGDPENTAVAAILPIHNIRVRITLVGAEFGPSVGTADAYAVKFMKGAQLTAGAIAPADLLSASFSGGAGGREELTFVFTKATGVPDLDAPASTFLNFPTDLPDNLQIAHAEAALGQANGQVTASITVENADLNTQILTGTVVLARSQWGLEVNQEQAPFYGQPAAEQAKEIDVASTDNRYSRFSPTGLIGGSNPASGETNYYNAGGFSLDITDAAHAGSNALSYVQGSTAPAKYAMNTGTAGAGFVVTVNGSDFSPWAPDGGRPNIWLSNSQTCATAGAITMAVNPANNTAVATIPANHAWVLSLGSPTATGTIYVCFGANSTTALVPQSNLSGSVAVNYNQPGQRRDDAPLMPFNLVPLRMNGTVFTFQNVNPASNNRAVSFLRLSSHNAADCPVTIQAKDDDGRMSGIVTTTIRAHESETFNSNALESGNDPRISGSFRDGTGRWFVRITAECTNLTASALNRNNEVGTVTDLTPQEGFGTQWSDSGVPVP